MWQQLYSLIYIGSVEICDSKEKRETFVYFCSLSRGMLNRISWLVANSHTNILILPTETWRRTKHDEWKGWNCVWVSLVSVVRLFFDRIKAQNTSWKDWHAWGDLIPFCVWLLMPFGRFWEWKLWVLFGMFLLAKMLNFIKSILSGLLGWFWQTVKITLYKVYKNLTESLTTRDGKIFLPMLADIKMKLFNGLDICFNPSSLHTQI